MPDTDTFLLKHKTVVHDIKECLFNHCKGKFQLEIEQFKQLTFNSLKYT